MAIKPIPDGYHSVQPYLSIAGVEQGCANVVHARDGLRRSFITPRCAHSLQQLGERGIERHDAHATVFRDAQGDVIASEIHVCPRERSGFRCARAAISQQLDEIRRVVRGAMAVAADVLDDAHELCARREIGVECRLLDFLAHDASGRVAKHLPGLASVAKRAPQAAERRVESSGANFAPICKRPRLDGFYGESANFDRAQIGADNFFPRAQQRLHTFLAEALRVWSQAALGFDARFFVHRLACGGVGEQQVQRGADGPLVRSVRRSGVLREPFGFEFREFSIGDGFQRRAE